MLAGVGAGVGALALGTGPVSADGSDRHVVGTSTQAATDLAKRKAKSVYRVLDFGDIGHAVAGRFPEEALDALEQNPNVRYIEVDGEMHAIQQLPWGIDRVDADVAHNNDSSQDDDSKSETGGDSGGADVAIIDTGIDSDHPDLDANLGNGKAIVECEPLSSRPGGCGFGIKTNDNPCNTKWDDDNNHGSHVSGTADAIDDDSHVVGVSTAATLHAVKVLDECGSGSFSDVAAGIKWVADQGYDVANMSLGADSGSSTVKDACQYAYDKGVLLVAAAGNSGPCSDCVGYPAAYSTVIAVSATTKDDQLADFSSTGPEVELAAPGKNVVSTVPPESDSDGLATYSGTSMASPHVAGTGGQLMDNGYTNTEARNQMNSTAEDIGLSSNEQGNGLVDTAAALGLDSSDDLGGGGNSAPTVDSLSATEVETSDSDAEFDVDWSVSDSNGNLSSVDLTLTDDTDGETEDTTSISVSGDTASGTTRLVAAGDDGSGNSYTVEAVVTDSDGASDSATTSVSETEDTSSGSAPTVDSHAVSTRKTGPWYRVEADWAVSDDDGDLDSVAVAIEDSNGNTLNSTTVDVSGSTASGSNELKARSKPSTSVVTVTDSKGNDDTSSKSVSF